MFSAVRCAARALSLLIFFNIFIFSVLRTLFNMALATFIGAECHTHTYARALTCVYMRSTTTKTNERTKFYLRMCDMKRMYDSVTVVQARKSFQMCGKLFDGNSNCFFFFVRNDSITQAIFYLRRRNLNMPKTTKSSELLLLLVCVCCESNRFRATSSPCR